MISNKKAEEDFSRKRLTDIYLGSNFSKGAMKFEGVMDPEKYKYKIHIPLVINEYDKTPVFSSVTIKNISPQGNKKDIVITSDKRDNCYKDEAHFGEFVFLLAAKLKHDLFSGLDYDKAGFLYSREIVRFKNVCKTTNVPPSILRELRRFHNKSSNHLFKNLFFGKDQLWHLICYYGETHGQPKENKLMWWLNVSPEDIHFLDEEKKPVSGRKLKSLFKNLFPEKHLIKPEEFDEFINIVQGEKTNRIKADREAKLIIWPDEISGAGETKVHPPDESCQAIDLLEEHKTIVGRTAQKEKIKKFITDSDRGILLITGPPGIGKTALLANLVHELSPIAAGGAVVPFFFSRESANYSLRTCLCSLYSALAKKSGLVVERAENEIDTLALQFAGLLQRLALERQAAAHVRQVKYDTPGQESEGNDRSTVFEESAPEIFIVDAVDEAENPGLFLRLIPKSLSPRTFFILSSRPGSHIQGFSALPGAGPPIMIEPRSPENISDARCFLQQHFHDWSGTVIKRIAARAEGNFLFLKLFADFVSRESIEETEAARWCDKFGATEEDPLRALYERYWLYLHDKCLQTAHPEDSDNINDLLGLLAITYIPISFPMIRRFLGKEWTTARFERVLRYVHQFMLVDTGRSEARDAQGKAYRLFHDTFKSFVSDRLSVDLPRLHGKIVVAYCDEENQELDTSRIDSYGLNYVIKHAALSEDSSFALSLVTPAFLKNKISRTSSIVPTLEDLSTATGVAAEQHDFGFTLKYAIAMESFIQSSRRKTLGVEAMLRARAGETAAAISDASFFGGADDELLVRTELFSRYWEQDPEFVADQLLQIDFLSAACSADSSAFDAGKKRVSAASLEAAVGRIARACPAAALRLASAIPEPSLIDDVSTGFENPTWGRAVWTVMAACAGDDPSLADELVGIMENELQRSLALVSLGAAMFTKNLGFAIKAFEKALSHVIDKNRSFLLLVIIRYCLSHFSSLSPEAAAASIDGLLQLGEVRLTVPDFSIAVDRSIKACPGSWAELAKGIEESDTKDLINWRLSELKSPRMLKPEAFKNESIKDMARAAKMGVLACRDPVAAAKLAYDVDTLQGYARAVAEVAKVVARNGRARAESMVELFLKSSSVENNLIGYWPVLELARIVVNWPGEVRRKVLTWCSNVAQELKPEFFRNDADIALNKLLAKAVVEAKPNESVFFNDIIREAGTETGREVLAIRILKELPKTLCLAIAEDLTSFGLGETEFDPLYPKERGLFLPETRANLLSLLAQRIGFADIDRGQQLLLQAGDLCASLEDEEDKDRVGGKLLHRVFQFSPLLALKAFHRCGCSGFCLRWAVSCVFSGLIESPACRRSKFMRLEWEVALGKKLVEADDLYWKRRYYALTQMDFPALGSSCSEDPGLTREWLGELPAFFRAYVHHFGLDSYDAREVGKIVGPVMQLDWPTFMDIVRESEVGSLLCRQVSIPKMRLAVFRSELPAPQLLEDVRFIAAAMSGKDNKQGSFQAEVQSCLVAAAASVDPGLCIRMVKSVSPDLRCEFRHDLSNFTPKAHWDEADLMELFSLFDAASDKADAVVTKARFLAWLGANLQISERFVEAIAGEAEVLSSVYSISQVAKCLRKFDSGLSDRLAETALKRAVEKRDARSIINVLEAHESISDRVRLESLAVAREADAATENRWTLDKIVKLQVNIDISQSIQTLSLMRSDDSDVGDALDDVAEAVAERSDSEVYSWMSRIQALKNLTESHRNRFVRTLIKQRMKSGNAVSGDLLNSLSDVDDWAEAYLRTNKPVTETEMALFEKELSGKITSSASFTCCEGAFRTLGNHYVASRPATALRFYRMALQEASKITPGIVLLFRASYFAKACLQLPEKQAMSLATDLVKTVKRYPFAKDHRDSPLDKARALLHISVALWPYDKAKADSLISEVTQEFYEKTQPASSTSPGFEIKYGFTSLVEHCGFDVGNAWVHRCIETFPKARQQEIIDKVCSELCEGYYDADEQLKELGVWQKRLGEIECKLLQELLPRCSESGRAKCHFAFAITHWGRDQACVLRELDLAVHNVKAAGDKLGRYTQSDIWLAYAATHGIEGVLHAMFALAQAGSLHTKIRYLLPMAVSNSERGRELVEAAWAALQQAEQLTK